MQLSALPTPLQQLEWRTFSFYPPILNIAHNEWSFRRATWSEIVVVNRSSGEEAYIPRVLVGEISIRENLVVGLRRELEWKRGAVYPLRCPVIELPAAANVARNVAAPARLRPEGPAQVVSIRLEQPVEKRAGRKIAVAIMLGSLASLLAAELVWQKSSPSILTTHHRGKAHRGGAR